MTTLLHNGRFCNNTIRCLCVSVIAKKHNLFVTYCDHPLLERLGIPLFVGTNQYPETITLTDDNYFDILNRPTLAYNLDPNSDYFQTRDISRLLYDHLRFHPNIMEKNPYNDRYNNNRDCFIHIRLGDKASDNPGLAYYMRVIESLGGDYDHIYVSSDSPDHQIVAELMQRYQGKITLFYRDEVDTIQFASTCKYVVLSHGSFSAVIGWLAFYSEVYYSEYEEGKIWYGDMFSIDGWYKFLRDAPEYVEGGTIDSL